jgi:hypothetical protein
MYTQPDDDDGGFRFNDFFTSNEYSVNNYSFFDYPRDHLCYHHKRNTDDWILDELTIRANFKSLYDNGYNVTGRSNDRYWHILPRFDRSVRTVDDGCPGDVKRFRHYWIAGGNRACRAALRCSRNFSTFLHATAPSPWRIDRDLQREGTNGVGLTQMNDSEEYVGFAGNDAGKNEEVYHNRSLGSAVNEGEYHNRSSKAVGNEEGEYHNRTVERGEYHNRTT